MSKHHDWMDQKSFIVTEWHLDLPWSGQGRVAFCCGFCLHIFELGETARWILMPGVPNTFVCVEHDGPDVIERWQHRWRNEIVPILKRWS